MNIHSMAPAADESKYEAILDAALELFAERGFHGTAVPLVAERAGVGTGTLYRYFESKEALVNAVYQRWKGRLGSSMLTDFPINKSVREQFHWFWRKMWDFVEKYPKAFAFLEFHHHATYMDETSKRLEQNLLEAARGFLEAARKQQVIKDVPVETLMALAWGAFFGLVKGSWIGQLSITPEVLDVSEQCMWEAIRR